MTCSFTPFGGGSRVVSLWDMLRFHADKFIEVLNTLNLLEFLLGDPENILSDSGMLSYFADELQRLQGQLLDLNLKFSTKSAERLRFGITDASRDNPKAWAEYIKKHSEELRVRVAEELEGKAIYYLSDYVDLLSETPLFGDQVNEAFPSARYDISEAGHCLALRRPTACVLHLMRTLESGLSSLSTALGISLTRKSWDTILNQLEKEIRLRSTETSDPKWKNEDEQFFAQSAIHFRMIKDAWRNHAMHGRDKYTDEEAEGIYDSVSSFMRHLSERLSEEELSS